MRVYIPSTFPALADVVARGDLGRPPHTAFAVTPALREWYMEGDIEALEYAAMAEAGRAALRLLEEDPSAPRRRVVLAAEVTDRAVGAAPDLGRAVVQVDAAIPLAAVVSIHVDGPEAEQDVRKAAEVVLAAELGDDDAQFVVDGVDDHEMLWYAAQEIPDLLR